MNTPSSPHTKHPTPDAAHASTEGQGQREQIKQQLEHRFRHHLQSGQLCPLLHLIMRYKLEPYT
jgi:hypothetical protein